MTMNQYKTWLLYKYGLIILLGIVLIISYNYVLDPYGILRKDFLDLRSEPNQNFIKVEYILSHPQKYDSFIFGSSRIGRLDPRKIPNEKYYNMTYSGGLPNNHLENIRLFLNNGVKIKNLVIGLEEISYIQNPINHLASPIRRPHYLTTNENFLKFYSFYFFKIPSYFDFYNLFHPERFSQFDIYNTGIHFRKDRDTLIEQNIDAHMNKEVFDWLIHKKSTIQSSHNLDGALNDIDEIVALAKENNINLIIFFQPLHKTTYLNITH